MHFLAVFCVALSFEPWKVTGANITVGIVGAGASGLYAAILLQSLGINYEILEASDVSGGRIRTHYFDPMAWEASTPGQPDYYDYYDVGAMRIPRTPFMDRLVGNSSNSLVRYINNRVSKEKTINLIPYIFSNDNSILYYNNVRCRSSDPLTGDFFGTNLPAFSRSSPFDIWDTIISSFTSSLNINFAQGFARLTRSGQSVRQYLTSLNFSFSEINWIETFLDSTGHFDLDLAEIVFEDWLFGSDDSYTWTTIEGGMTRLINGMIALLKTPIRYSTRIVAISQITPHSPQVTLTTAAGSSLTYSHVINTAPLGALQSMDLSTLSLPSSTSSAIRMVNYDAALKIGIRFKSRWWQEKLTPPILGGQSATDLPLRTVVYPSHGIHVPNAAAVLIASYTWGQDASRLSAFLHSANNSPSNSSEQLLIDQTLGSLATLHDLPLSFLREQYLSHHAYSWYDSSTSIGAFPAFGPGQFAGMMMADLMVPAGRGRVHWGGDATSAGHAWIVGGLNAGFRCAREILEAEGMGGKQGKGGELERMWGGLIDIEPRNGSFGGLFDDSVSTSRRKRGRTARRGARRSR